MGDTLEWRSEGWRPWESLLGEMTLRQKGRLLETKLRLACLSRASCHASNDSTTDAATTQSGLIHSVLPISTGCFRKETM